MLNTVIDKVAEVHTQLCNEIAHIVKTLSTSPFENTESENTEIELVDWVLMYNSNNGNVYAKHFPKRFPKNAYDMLEVLSVNELYDIATHLRYKLEDQHLLHIVDTCTDASHSNEDVLKHFDKLGMLKNDDVHNHNVGSSDYSKHFIQPWHIWQEYNLNPWDADIVKRILRTKEGDSRVTDYKKIIHICNERIRQLTYGENSDNSNPVSS